jgi:hypothetical protein
MNTDVGSCAAGVRDAQSLLSKVQSGATHDVKDAIALVDGGAANCSPANSMPMEDLVQYQVHESLASFHLQPVVNGLVIWAFPLAQRVQSDVAAVLGSRTPAARARASARLRRDRRALDAERAAIDSRITSADRSLAAHVPPPRLPG